MHIRIAEEKDLSTLIKLKNVHDEGYYKALMKEMARGEAVILVAEEDGEVCGQVALKYYGASNHHDYPGILDLRVAEDVRGNGIGSELIGVCEQLASMRGFNLIGITVNPALNGRARRLYERLGYIPTSRAPYLDGEYDGQENWVIDMTKRLVAIN